LPAIVAADRMTAAVSGRGDANRRGKAAVVTDAWKNGRIADAKDTIRREKAVAVRDAWKSA